MGMTINLLTRVSCEGKVVFHPAADLLQHGSQIELFQCGSRRLQDRYDRASAMSTAQ
jgi:hypothetical protein